MTDRAMKGLTPPPSTRQELNRTVNNLKRSLLLTPPQLEAFDHEVERAFPGGFDHRDEANALVAMAVRNGPLENLHAGLSSPLLEDESLSRLTDAEMKALMLFATRTLALMLRLRDEAPEEYRQYIQSYGSQYCHSWERSA